MITLGVDVGTRFLKIAIVEDQALLGTACLEMNRRFKSVFGEALDLAITDAKKISGRRIRKMFIRRMVATGYGAHLVKKAYSVAEDAACTAKGAWALNLYATHAIDAGGFFIRAITLEDRGSVKKASVNDKCAAGSGKFLEMIAQILEIPFHEISTYAMAAVDPFPLTNSCAVFAESDVISQINSGRSPQDMIAGVIQSIVRKTETLLYDGKEGGDVCVMGGLASVPAYVTFLKNMTGLRVIVPPMNPRLVTAYGAALIAGER